MAGHTPAAKKANAKPKITKAAAYAKGEKMESKSEKAKETARGMKALKKGK
jgi:hypothetical protein